MSVMYRHRVPLFNLLGTCENVFLLPWAPVATLNIVRKKGELSTAWQS